MTENVPALSLLCLFEKRDYNYLHTVKPYLVLILVLASRLYAADSYTQFAFPGACKKVPAAAAPQTPDQPLPFEPIPEGWTAISLPPRGLGPHFIARPRWYNGRKPIEQPQPEKPTPSESAAKIEPSLTAKGYKLERIAGAGGFAGVFLATSPEGKPVALKILRTTNPDMVERFQREGKLLEELAAAEAGKADRFFPEKVRVLEVDGQTVIEMEFIAEKPNSPNVAPSLATLIAKGDPLVTSEGSRQNIQDQILEALERAHALGIVHRDLKPSNIVVFLNERGEVRVKLVDWGIAAKTREAGGSGWEVGRAMGTPGYFGAEQHAGEAARPAQDLFAVRALFFEMDLMGVDPASRGYPGIPTDAGAKDYVAGAKYAADHEVTVDGRPIHPSRRRLRAVNFSGVIPSVAELKRLRALAVRENVEAQKDLLSSMAEHLRKADGPPSFALAAARPKAALEILQSRWLIENFHWQSGLSFSRNEMAEIVRGAFVLKKRVDLGMTDRALVAPYGEHPDLLFKEFFDYVAKNREALGLSELSVYEQEAAAWMRR